MHYILFVALSCLGKKRGDWTRYEDCGRIVVRRTALTVTTTADHEWDIRAVKIYDKASLSPSLGDRYSNQPAITSCRAKLCIANVFWSIVQDFQKWSGTIGTLRHIYKEKRRRLVDSVD